MKNKITLISSLFVVVVVFSIYVMIQNRNEKDLNFSSGAESEIILFYSNNCPFCKIVDNYIDQNNIEDKINLEHKGVDENRQNSNQLIEKAKHCGYSVNNIAVPLLWDGENCFVGDKEIIDFFESLIN